MPHRMLALLSPVVHHTYLEHLAGVPVQHVLMQAAIAGAFVGAGLSPLHALQATETVERLTGLVLQERPVYHRAELAALRRGLVHPAMAPGFMELATGVPIGLRMPVGMDP